MINAMSQMYIVLPLWSATKTASQLQPFLF